LCCVKNSEHEELTRQIKEASDRRLRDDLERELDDLVSRMEAKSNQITKLRRFHDKVSKFLLSSL
jgi:centrosomal protein CEP57